MKNVKRNCKLFLKIIFQYYEEEKVWQIWN